MRSFLSAIGFLTIIPVSKQEINSSTILWFPVVGLLLGGLLFLLNFIFSSVLQLNPMISVALLLVIYIFLTGGLHIDGLSDTIDGIAVNSGDNLSKIFSVMDDSHIGAVGVLAIVCDILLKFVLLINLPADILPKILLIFPVISRWAVVLSMFISKPAKNTGLGKSFIENTKLWNFSISTSVCILLCTVIFMSVKTFIAILTSVLVVLFSTRFFIKKLGGMTGDALGAINEIVEITVLAVATI